MAATCCFTINDATVKVLLRTAPVGEVLFARGVMTCLLVGTVLAAMGHFVDLRLTMNRLVLARSTLEALAALLFTSALIHMRLAELSTIVLVSPLIITALAVLFFREAVGWRRWSAITVGFIGTLFVVKPTPSAFDAWAVLGLLCALASASRDLITRQLRRGIPSIIVSFMSAVSVTLAGALVGFWEDWRTLVWSEIGLLAVSAVFMAAGNYLVILAFRDGEISVVSPFRYSLLVWAGIAGYVVFGELPDRWAICGALLIVGSGIYALHREGVRRREAAARIAP